jgi:hypothetical protein
MGGLEEPTIGAWGGSKVMKFSGMTRYHEEEPNELSIMAKHSNQETDEVEEARGASLECRGKEEIMEGEPGGETEARGWGGCHGEPLSGHPL